MPATKPAKLITAILLLIAATSIAMTQDVLRGPDICVEWTPWAGFSDPQGTAAAFAAIRRADHLWKTRYGLSEAAWRDLPAGARPYLRRLPNCSRQPW